VLNADVLRHRIEAKSSKGQAGARHFDNLTWELAIPDYEPGSALHGALAALALEAEQAAAAVVLADGAYFTAHRKAIRDALQAAGITARLGAGDGTGPALTAGARGAARPPAGAWGQSPHYPTNIPWHL
jgi:hypothetical protein